MQQEKKGDYSTIPIPTKLITPLGFLSMTVVVFAPFNAYRIPLSSLLTLSTSKIFQAGALLLLFAHLTISAKASKRFNCFLSKYNSITLSYLLMLTIFTLMLIRSYSPSYGLKIMALSTVVVSMSFSIAYWARCPKRLIFTINTLLVSSIFVSGFAIYQLVHFRVYGEIPSAPFLQYLPLPHEDSQLHRAFMWYIPGVIPRVMSVMTEPNSLGHYLAIVLFTSIWLLKYRTSLGLNRKTRTLALLTIAISLIPFAMTFSRSGWLTFILGLGILSIDLRPQSMIRTAILVVASVTTIAITSAAIPELREALSQRVTLSETSGHVEVRLQALTFFSESPILGIGFGNYGILTGGPFGVSSTHSYYVTYLVEGGILGGLAFLTFISSLSLIFIKKTNGKLSKNPYWILGFGIALATGFNNIFYHTFWLETTWISIGISLAAFYIFSCQKNKINKTWPKPQ